MPSPRPETVLSTPLPAPAEDHKLATDFTSTALLQAACPLTSNSLPSPLRQTTRSAFNIASTHSACSLLTRVGQIAYSTTGSAANILSSPASSLARTRSSTASSLRGSARYLIGFVGNRRRFATGRFVERTCEPSASPKPGRASSAAFQRLMSQLGSHCKTWPCEAEKSIRAGRGGNVPVAAPVALLAPETAVSVPLPTASVAVSAVLFTVL